MKFKIAFFLVIISFISQATKTPEYIPQVMLVSSEKSDTLAQNESIYMFKFIGLYNENEILYSIDGYNQKSMLDLNNEIHVLTTPGAHNFQFYYNDQHYEIYADSLTVLAQHINTYEVRFESSEFPVSVEKPVIYLYPQVETPFTISVHPKGKMAFTYPVYNGEWKGTATPNGDIKIGNEMFNYLFWEADQTIDLKIIDSKKGAIVKGEESVTFLENQLDKFGFNSKEKADFITFWGPKMAKNELNYVYFVLNNEADYFAELAIKPTPDNIYRFYMLTCPVANSSDFYYLEPQLIEKINRTGFTILEWGGSVIDNLNLRNRLQSL